MDLSKLNFIIKKFFLNSQVLSINKIDSGIINSTFIVEHLYKGLKTKFILQCLSNIFVSHDVVNMNHILITDHMEEKINKGNIYAKKWKVPNLIKCKSNNLFYFPFESDTWRAMVFIDETLSLASLEDNKMAYQTGIGLSKFHLICSDFDHSRLKNSIKNFHNTKYYINHYIYTLEKFNFLELDNKINKRINKLITSLSHHLEFVNALMISLKNEAIKRNVIHGDPKLSNFLFDSEHKHVVSLIDLDTVSSGYLLTDLADCIRSICNLAGDGTKNSNNVCFDIGVCKYFLKGYFSISANNEDSSFRLLPEFIYLIIFELTIRFLTDFMQSNKYFTIQYESHNLFRAEVQYQLLSSFLIQVPNLSNALIEIGISPGSTLTSYVQKFA